MGAGDGESDDPPDQRHERTPPERGPNNPTGRQRYCTSACRKTAFRRRHQNPPTAVVVPVARPRRQFTIYECPNCGDRFLGQQRCPACATFARRAGIGGPCPHCDEPVALTDLLDQEVSIVPKR